MKNERVKVKAQEFALRFLPRAFRLRSANRFGPYGAGVTATVSDNAEPYQMKAVRDDLQKIAEQISHSVVATSKFDRDFKAEVPIWYGPLGQVVDALLSTDEINVSLAYNMQGQLVFVLRPMFMIQGENPADPDYDPEPYAVEMEKFTRNLASVLREVDIAC